MGIDDVVAKGQVGGEDVAGQGGEKKVDQDWPARFERNCGPGLQDRPPKEEAGKDKTEMLDRVHGMGAQGESKDRRDVPANEYTGRCQPAGDWVCEKSAKMADRPPAEHRKEDLSQELLGEPVGKCLDRIGEKDEGRSDRH